MILDLIFSFLLLYRRSNDGVLYFGWFLEDPGSSSDTEELFLLRHRGAVPPQTQRSCRRMWGADLHRRWSQRVKGLYVVSFLSQSTRHTDTRLCCWMYSFIIVLCHSCLLRGHSRLQGQVQVLFLSTSARVWLKTQRWVCFMQTQFNQVILFLSSSSPFLVQFLSSFSPVLVQF